MSTPSLQILFNDQVLTRVPLDKPTITIGRFKDNDIVINNLSVSRLHAKITLQNGHVFLEDQGSENGSFVNGERITKTEITPKDEIMIGKHQLVLEVPELPAPATKEQYYFDHPGDISFTQEVKIRENANHDDENNVTFKGKVEKTADPPPLSQAPPESENAAAAPTPAAAEFTKAPSESASPRATLIVRHEGAADFEQTIDQNVFCIGRSLNSDMVLDQPQVSRRHALIYRLPDRFELQDLDTGNGTFLNGEKIRRAPLKSGDQISIGNYEISFACPLVMTLPKVATKEPAAAEVKAELKLEALVPDNQSEVLAPATDSDETSITIEKSPMPPIEARPAELPSSHELDTEDVENAEAEISIDMGEFSSDDDAIPMPPEATPNPPLSTPLSPAPISLGITTEKASLTLHIGPLSPDIINGLATLLKLPRAANENIDKSEFIEIPVKVVLSSDKSGKS